MRHPKVIDQYLLRRSDGSLELWLTDALGLSWSRCWWPWPAPVSHCFRKEGDITLVGASVIPGYTPEVSEDGPCDCTHGCRFAR